ncbi:Rieske (2Fe-2S) protein [Kordiimonas sp. SCSIO 12610]|uniref:Rieske (2Fe-2S) protein n=1 Tax=Kordiimonas sp. SCSIO 12610 TaxID=2829597 RepID=UPI00210E4301|nr:Rieske (2Fe-2S) protein [Kordiimonas sp. SCSIO 12610]UTW56552.1 Rieske (2Fe-2S) protein [Kordiimonas sp. SCSIO 12610]
MAPFDFSSRPKTIDYNRISKLHYLGNYVRPLPVSMTRMMENAYDWEHLPYVHPSSFAGIELLDSGTWGWRAKTTLPGQADNPVFQHIELLVDCTRNYWATTVLDGPGEGIEIHTQASKQISKQANELESKTGDHGIEVDVRFYLPEKPEDQGFSDALLRMMQVQYQTLYDEDQDLMQGRQEAIDRKNISGTSLKDPNQVSIPIAAIEGQLPHILEYKGTRYCIRKWNNEWVIYAADCPHLLGPLEHSSIDKDGTITCPWHGYKFSIKTGKNCDGKSSALQPAPELSVEENELKICFPNL